MSAYVFMLNLEAQNLHCFSLYCCFHGATLASSISSSLNSATEFQAGTAKMKITILAKYSVMGKSADCHCRECSGKEETEKTSALLFIIHVGL